jgi:pimeloyl-ACP methyl ester carboxylesterase
VSNQSHTIEMSSSYFGVVTPFFTHTSASWLVRGLARGLIVTGLACLVSAALAKGNANLQPCRQPGLPNEVLCGVIQRPLKPDEPGGRQINVHYVVVPALARQKSPDPIVFLAGGPGQSAIDLAPQLTALWSRGNSQRDLVLIDQRGTGLSAPLMCQDEPRGNLSAQALAMQVARLRQCRDDLSSQPDVGGPEGLKWFTTSVAVQDFDAIREALGAPQVNVVGGSYGTRVALEWMRLFPEKIRRVVLDGAAPPDMALPYSSAQDGEAALESLFKACEQETACAKKHPALRSKWDQLWKSLPQTATLNHPVDGRREMVSVTPDLLASWVRGPLYMPSLAAGLPAALSAAGQGRWEGLAGLNAVLSARQGLSRVALGMHFSVVCSEDAPRVPAMPQVPGSAQWNLSGQQLYAQVCTDWPRAEVSPDFVKLPRSKVPVLILSGGLDPITPPRHGQRVAEALGPMARHWVFPNAGHGLMGLGCIGDLILQFIHAKDDASALAVNHRCAEHIPRPPMFEPPGGAP